MPTKIRLQRHGKKKSSFYHIVIADSRAPRDGKFIEKIGTYNPNTNPATTVLQFDRALNWLQKGAQPTDTARAILSYEGVLYRNHLDVGVRKGALKEADADKKFEAWKKEKLDKIQAKTDNVAKTQQDIKAKQLANESEINKKRADEVLAKTSALAAEAEAATAAPEATTEEASAETVENSEVKEAPAAEATETVAETPAPAETEVKEEAAPEEKKEEETPKAEEKKEEAPKAEAEAKEETKEEAPAEEEKKEE